MGTERSDIRHSGYVESIIIMRVGVEQEEEEEGDVDKDRWSFPGVGWGGRLRVIARRKRSERNERGDG